MFPVGGVDVMLAGAAVSGVLVALIGLALTRGLGWVRAWSLVGLVWSLVVIGLVTLIPTDGVPGVVSAASRRPTCSFDIGGPAPQGFWIFSSGQRVLNTVLFVPSGVLLVVFLVATARWWALVLVPIGLGLLAAYSVGIEATQLELARLDRACDITDVVDNSTGAALGVGIGLGLVLLFLPTVTRRKTT